jgi:tRNA(fMet)-specific endonuclease VapC
LARVLSVDTSFLIDLERERRSGAGGPAHRFLLAEPDVQLALPTVALGELTEGFADPSHPWLAAVRRGHRLLPVDEKVAHAYGTITRQLRANGRLLGAHDLWIGATTLRFELPLLTADTDHFRRIQGLQLVSYR